MAASKKWKYTLRVPIKGGEQVLLGDWMEARGLAVKTHLRSPRCHMSPPLSSERGTGLLPGPSDGAPRSGGRDAGQTSTRVTRDASVRRRGGTPSSQAEVPAADPAAAATPSLVAEPVAGAYFPPARPITPSGASAAPSYFRPVQAGAAPSPSPHPGSAFNPVGSRLGATNRDPRVLAFYRSGAGPAPGKVEGARTASPATSAGRGGRAAQVGGPEAKRPRIAKGMPLEVQSAPSTHVSAHAGMGPGRRGSQPVADAEAGGG